MRTRPGPGWLPALGALCLLVGSSQPAAAQKFNPRVPVEMIPKEDTEMEFGWGVPKLANWTTETDTMPEGRKFLDRIMRRNSPRDQPDMALFLTGYSHESTFNYMFYNKTDRELEAIIKGDTTLREAEHQDVQTEVLALWEAAAKERVTVDQTKALDRLLSYRESKRIHYGKDLEGVCDEYDKGDYYDKVAVKPDSVGVLADAQRRYFVQNMADGVQSVPRKGTKKIAIGKGGKIKAEMFMLKGKTRDTLSPVVYEVYVFRMRGWSVVARIQYGPGMEKDPEVRIVKNQILAAFEKL